MPELDKIYEAETLSISRQKEVRKEIKHLGRLKIQKGQSLWELNTQTFRIQKIVFDKAVVEMNGTVRRKFVIKENCLYVVALNIENANKKFKKIVNA